MNMIYGQGRRGWKRDCGRVEKVPSTFPACGGDADLCRCRVPEKAMENGGKGERQEAMVGAKVRA